MTCIRKTGTSPRAILCCLLSTQLLCQVHKEIVTRGAACTECENDSLALLSQVEVARMPARALSAGSGHDATSAHLSPMLPFDALPAVVDVMRTVWPINLHGSAAPGENPLGSVMDVSLLDASNHARGDLPLPPSPVNASFPGGSLPVHFLVPVEQGECLRDPQAGNTPVSGEGTEGLCPRRLGSLRTKCCLLCVWRRRV